MNQSSRIGLGTVQLGMEYGVTNQSGRPSLEEAAAIVRVAAEHGVRVIDTAAVYGKSERVLGKTLDMTHDFRIVTKILPLRERTIGNRQIDLVKVGLRPLAASPGCCRTSRVCSSTIPTICLPTAANGCGRRCATFRNRDASRRSASRSTTTINWRPSSAGSPSIWCNCRSMSSINGRSSAGGWRACMRPGFEVHARSAFLQGILLAQADGFARSVCRRCDRIWRNTTGFA